MRIKKTVLSCMALAAITGPFAVLAAPAYAAGRPVKEIQEREFGFKVNKNGGNLCLVQTEECEATPPTSETGGFAYPQSVAVGPAPEHNVYVADNLNGRIEVFTSEGAFVGMFGWDVNKTKTLSNTGTQQEKDVCTATETQSGTECQAGQEPSSYGIAGQIAKPQSVAVDQSTGDLYVYDRLAYRVDKYSSTGVFLWMAGRKVNKNGSNLCTNTEEAQCQTGEESAVGSSEPSAFKTAESGDILAMGPGQILYVGDEDRIQQIEPDGNYKTAVPVSGHVTGLAVNQLGETYLVDETYFNKAHAEIHKLAANGSEITTTCAEGSTACWPLVATPVLPTGFNLVFGSLAVDQDNRLAVAALEEYRDVQLNRQDHFFGLLLDGGTGETITNFNTVDPVGSGVDVLTFGGVETNGGFKMYGAFDNDDQEVTAYTPVPVAEAKMATSVSCHPGPEHESDLTFDCPLAGGVNPWGVPNTQDWFEWGVSSALGRLTPKSA